MAIGLALPLSPLAPALGLVPLPRAYYGWLAAILVCYACLSQLVKTWFVRRYGYN
jgi:P-type Mg2+ transporter